MPYPIGTAPGPGEDVADPLDLYALPQTGLKHVLLLGAKAAAGFGRLADRTMVFDHEERAVFGF